jgi:hypothetical protein
VRAAGGDEPSGAAASPDGSTLRSTWVDPDRSGVVRVGPGEPLLERTELAPVSRYRRVLATLAHVTDAHVLDARSPARVSLMSRDAADEMELEPGLEVAALVTSTDVMSHADPDHGKRRVVSLRSSARAASRPGGACRRGGPGRRTRRGGGRVGNRGTRRLGNHRRVGDLTELRDQVLPLRGRQC